MEVRPTVEALYEQHVSTTVSFFVVCVYYSIVCCSMCLLQYRFFVVCVYYSIVFL